MDGYLQDWTVVRLDDGIRWLLGNHAGQLGGDFHGVSVLDGHVVGNSPPSSRRSAKLRSLPRREELTLSFPLFLASFAFRPRASSEYYRRALPLCLGQKAPRWLVDSPLGLANLNDLCW